MAMKMKNAPLSETVIAVRSTASLIRVLLKKLSSFEQGGSIIEKNRWIKLLIDKYFEFFPSMGIWGFMMP